MSATAAVALLAGTHGFALPPSPRAAIGDPKPPPAPEPIEIIKLPLPPVSPSNATGACSLDVNPAGTGCILQSGGLEQAGGFLPDGKHVSAAVNFAGAPAAPDPLSIFTGMQLIIVKTDGTNFSNGNPWKCITCGVPEANDHRVNFDLGYPQPYRNGKSILAGASIIDCGGADFADDECTPEKTSIYSIRWNNTPDGSGPGGALRELRIHPDNVHLGWSSFGVEHGRYTQFAYLGRLELNESPTTGEPLAPRFDLSNVITLHSEVPEQQPWLRNGDRLTFNPKQISVGELRGFSGTGQEVTYVGYSYESSNIDVFAINLVTGAVRRITAHPDYCDPTDISPDDQWSVVMDTRGSKRQMFMAGMRYIPPLTDMISSSVAASTRNNGPRRFFQPYLLDHDGDRGTYFGQQLNGEGDGSPGSLNDPNWNGRADPRWSHDGTMVVFWQAIVRSPSCGGENPLPCPESTEPGGRTERLLVAKLTSRTPLKSDPIEPISDEIPWGVKYEPGRPQPKRPQPPAGTYTLDGTVSGTANVTIIYNADNTLINSVAVSYINYSDVRETVLNGWENVTVEYPSPTLNTIDWFSDLVQEGTEETGKLVEKKTSPDGFHLSIDILTNIFDANGTLKTTIDGVTYEQPANGT
ncbi:hypothetical protein CC80DRAFT_477145 [Byssothecium circinans]|uniref:Saponin hydrolase n=1 Tax=Byssothecium circinans TaxID=147558 RepID=A0A6A5TLG2_9PLEO|nr:hypothetical protein CC80DRAFT_477145 [Byssothecium circinans]